MIFKFSKKDRDILKKSTPDMVWTRMEWLERELTEAHEIIDCLIEHLDASIPDSQSKYVDLDGNESIHKDWMMFVCFGEDHELYDRIQALGSP